MLAERQDRFAEKAVRVIALWASALARPRAGTRLCCALVCQALHQQPACLVVIGMDLPAGVRLVPEFAADVTSVEHILCKTS